MYILLCIYIYRKYILCTLCRCIYIYICEDSICKYFPMEKLKKSCFAKYLVYNNYRLSLKPGCLNILAYFKWKLYQFSYKHTFY